MLQEETTKNSLVLQSGIRNAILRFTLFFLWDALIAQNHGQ